MFDSITEQGGLCANCSKKTVPYDFNSNTQVSIIPYCIQFIFYAKK